MVYHKLNPVSSVRGRCVTLAEDILHCLSQLVSRVSDSLCVEVKVHRAPHTKVTQAPMIKLLNLLSLI